MMLPVDALGQAFETHPPLRMQLLAELAREVSRAYLSGCTTRTAGIRRRAAKMSAMEG
jgi:CRP-like cAMP-binding protein